MDNRKPLSPALQRRLLDEEFQRLERQEVNIHSHQSPIQTKYPTHFNEKIDKGLFNVPEFSVLTQLKRGL